MASTGLSCNPDMFHFNARSQRIFGLRYFTAFPQNRCVTEPVAGEERILAQKTEGGRSSQAITAQLKKQLQDGCITKGEYDARMDALIRTL